MRGRRRDRRARSRGELYRQLVHGSGAVSLEDVDPDEIAANLADLGGDLTERAWPVRKPEPDDRVTGHVSS